MGRVFARESQAGAPKEEQRRDCLSLTASVGWGEEAMLLSAPCGLLDLLRRLGQCHQAREREVRAQLVERGHSHTLSWRMVGSAPRRELFAGRMGWRTVAPSCCVLRGGGFWGADGDVEAQREPRACCSTQQLMVGFVQAALSAPLSSSVLQWWRGSHRQSSCHFTQLLRVSAVLLLL